MKKIAIKYGLWMFIGFTLFFLVMHLLGFSESFEARLLNGVIHLSLLYLAIQEYRNANDTIGAPNYMRGVAVGMYATFIGVLAFTVFMIIFLSVNDSFMLALKNHFEIGQYLNPLMASLFIFVEGIAVGLIGSYIITRVQESDMISASA